MVVTRDVNDQGAGTSVRCRCMCRCLSCRNEKQHTGALVPPPTDMKSQDVCRCPVWTRQAGSLTTLRLLAGAWRSRRRQNHVRHRPPCSVSLAQSPHRSRPRPLFRSSSYIHTLTLYHHHQLSCDHLRSLRCTLVACLQEPHVARPA